MIIKLTTECPKNGFIIYWTHPETSPEKSREGRMTEGAFATLKNIHIAFLKTTTLLFVTVGAVHRGCKATKHRPETSWTQSVSTLCARDPSLDEHDIMGLLSTIMTQ